MELIENGQVASAWTIGTAPVATHPPTPRLVVRTWVAMTLLALLVMAPLAGRPTRFVFDESVYVAGSRWILAHEGILNPEHPPLAKLMFAAGMAVVGDNPAGWRIAGIVCGAITVGLVFLWTYLLLADYSLAITAALLTLFNNFHFVMSRTTMLDVPMFMFATAALLGFTASLKCNVGLWKRRGLLTACGVMLGLALACKWTALDTVAALFAVTLILLCSKMIKSSWIDPELSTAAGVLWEIGLPTILAALIVIPVLTYALMFIPVFQSMHVPFTLRGVARFQIEMWRLSKGVMGNLAIYLPWYRWPLNLSPMRGLSYLQANPAVMWSGLAALVACTFRLIRRITLPELLIVPLYCASLLQWAVTPRAITYYYYYYPAVMFLTVATAVALKRTRQEIFGVRLSYLLCLAAAVLFIYNYPQMTHLEAPWDCMFGCRI